MFLTPNELNFELLIKNSKKENEKECVKAVLYIVILEYSLYSKLSCCIRFIQVHIVKNCDRDLENAGKMKFVDFVKFTENIGPPAI